MDTTASHRAPASATIRSDGSGVVVVGTRTELIAESTVERARARALGVLISAAAEQDRSLTVVSKDPAGTAHLVVSPQGTVEESTGPIEVEPEQAPEVGVAAQPTPDIATPVSANSVPDVAAPVSASSLNDARSAADSPLSMPAPSGSGVKAPAFKVPNIPSKSAPADPAPEDDAPKTRAAAHTAPQPEQPVSVTERTPGPARRSFIEENAQTTRAERGLRGALNKMGFKLAPNSSEASERTDINRVSQHWPGPRTIAIVNGKGGASKTPTTAMLSAVFARNGGSGVLAWDNNETRGTLGWRTEQGQHEETVQALLPNADVLMSAQAQASDLSRYLHHQLADKYDVLRSNPNILAEDQRLTKEEFDAIHAVAAKYFRLIFIDSGNDESADRWRRMIDRADQIVIATTARGEHAEAGALLLEALRDRGEHSAQLARDAVVVVSQADHKAGTKQAEHVAEGFRNIARSAVVVPFDPAMRAGKLSFDALEPQTQRAWLSAAAAVAQGL